MSVSSEKYASAMRTDAINMFVGVREIAARYRVSRGTVLRWVKESEFPIPVGAIDGHPAWHVESVNAWWHSSGRGQ